MVVIAALGIISIVGLVLGYLQVIHFGNLTRRKVVWGILVLALLITVVGTLHWLELITQLLAAQFTMALYVVCAGFFVGSGIQLIVKRAKAGPVEYVNRTFATDILPNLIAVAIVAYGIYRTALLTDEIMTGVRVTSGMSLIGFGFYGWTLRVVPEFRKKGILLLDRFIPWDKFIAYEWYTEESITIDYFDPNGSICDFTTLIPTEDQLEVERLLNRKIDEHKSEKPLKQVS